MSKSSTSNLTASMPGAWLILTAGLLWGTSGTAQSFAPAGYDPLVIGFLRILVGGLVLLIVAIFRRDLGTYSSWPLLMTIVGAASVAAFQVTFFSAVHKTGVAVGTIVGVGSAPISAGVLAYLLRKERPGKPWLFATLIGIIGCGLLIASSHSGQLAINRAGLLLALGAGFSYAVYAMAVKDLLKTKSSVAVMAILACLGSVMLLPLVYGGDPGWLFQPRGFLVAGYLGLFSYAVPMVCFARGLTTTSVSTAVTLTLAEPMTAGLLAVLVVGEQLSFVAWCGLLMVLCGLLILTLPRPAVSH